MSHGKMHGSATNNYIMHWDDDDYYGGDEDWKCCPVCQLPVQQKSLLKHAMERDDVEHAVYAVHQS